MREYQVHKHLRDSNIFHNYKSNVKDYFQSDLEQ